MAKILGLDLGTNSIGWAITEQTDDRFLLLGHGVNIFQEGVAREKGVERPMVQDRTKARASRRHYFRRRLRKIELLKVLIANDMCPYLSDETLDAWRHSKQYPRDDEFLGWLRTNEKDSKNPYCDRYLSLTSTLDLSEQRDRYILGRALYHLTQRRGFLSNRKDGENNDDGVVNGAITRLDEDMLDAGCNYLGEFYYKLHLNREKIRTGNGYGYAGRIAHYEKEFKAICEKQNLSEDLQEALHRAIFFQRPLKSQKGLVGNCTFEKDKSRCPISHPNFEEFRMRSFINNIKIKTPNDSELRKLNADEVLLIEPLFYRKTKEHFDFEDIAKKLSGGKKDSYGYIKDTRDVAYKFNYKMSTSVSGSPVTAYLRDIFGEEWVDTICSLYAKGEGKTRQQIINDVWHSLFSFDDNNKLRDWAKLNLQINDKEAETFVKIPIKQGYAALSLNAIDKILPYLRAGYRYDSAVFIANLRKVASKDQWENVDVRTSIINDVCEILDTFDSEIQYKHKTKKQAIDEMLLINHGINFNASARLYEPSRLEAYPAVQPDKNGVFKLGSPRTSSIRNPMAMRALFRLRALVNQLLLEGKIDVNTKINIEFARELNDANKRNAIERYQREIENKHKEYAKEITTLYKTECGVDVKLSADDILKYQLWLEQNKRCLYTGDQISICEFIGPNPKYDIEHTIPRSRGGNNAQTNKTLCQGDFNRLIKREKLPAELANHNEIMARIEQLGWSNEVEELDKRIARCTRSAKMATTKEAKDKSIAERHYLRMKRDYLQCKLDSFEMTEVNNNFTNRQGVDIGIIGKYAKLYLETVFRRVYAIKSAATFEFRKMWGLQEEFTKKERVNHIHHCIDAITVACIGSGTYAKWAQFQIDEERYRYYGGHKPVFDKPWETFTEDVKSIANDLLVSHYTADNMHKHSRKKLRVRGKEQTNGDGKPIYVQGDTARASLHQQTFYGAIKRDDEIKYVVRKPLDALHPADVDKIVDEAVKTCVKNAIEREGFKEAMSKPICFNESKGVFIKKVRIYTASNLSPKPLGHKTHRDKSQYDYKQPYYVVYGGNYCMAIYEGLDNKGKVKRSYNLISNLEAAAFYNGKTMRDDLVALSDSNDYPLQYILRAGTMVLFYENSPKELYECSRAELSKRLYKVKGLCDKKTGNNRTAYITMIHHQEARPDSDLVIKKGVFIANEEYRPIIEQSHNQLNVFVEGYDFELTVTGEIKFKH
ncbi:MAG: CRISPR-associated protein Csn1 [Alistipes sp.]|nr:CRISPR-associated protein Csn1 [Alistipes sp.]